MKYIITILGMCIFCTSCSTTKKIKSVTKTEERSSVVSNSDSTVKKTVDSVSVKKDNTVTTIETSDDYEKETVIEFDTVKYSWEVRNDTKIADYFPPISRIIIKEKGVKKENIVVVANVSDSTKFTKSEETDLSKNVKTDFVKTETVKNKEVKSKSYWWVLWFVIPVVIYLIGWYYGWWKWLIVLLRRKKNDYPVKYTKYKLPGKHE